MLNILGSVNRFHRGMDRRTAMRIGGLGAASLTLPNVLRHDALAAADRTKNANPGRAKQILLVYLQGAASQFETWDPKPDAPESIRGECGAIQTSVPRSVDLWPVAEARGARRPDRRLSVR